MSLVHKRAKFYKRKKKTWKDEGIFKVCGSQVKSYSQIQSVIINKTVKRDRT